MFFVVVVGFLGNSHYFFALAVNVLYFVAKLFANKTERNAHTKRLYQCGFYEY